MKTFWLGALLAAVCTGHAQNLVPNGSFEDLTFCPTGFSDFRIPGWQSPTRGTPDLYNACNLGEEGVPYNWAGASYPHSGRGYAGIYLWNRNDKDLHRSYREYMECRLLEPLAAGKRYDIGFYYKLASHSVYAVNRVGLLLTDSVIRLTSDETISRIPTLSVERDSAITGDTGGWEFASVNYEARGGECVLIIGNFYDNEATKSAYLAYRLGKSPMLSASAYYYIDDVFVLPTEPNPITEFDTLGTGRTLVLRNIQFAFDKYDLLPSSLPELDVLVDFLTRYPALNVILSGHTDDLGSDAYNMELSTNRANSVRAYLVGQGIDPDRIAAKGYGKSVPLVPEQTEEARSKNRRVEVRFEP